MAGTYVEGVHVDVAPQLAYFQDIANSAITASTNQASILSTQYTFSPDSVNITDSSTSSTELESIQDPSLPIIAFPTIEAPSSLLIETPFIKTSISPTFTDSPLPINLPTTPGDLEISAPVKNFTLDLSTEYKIPPNYIVPSVPTFESLNIPSIPPSLIEINFTQDLPTSSSLVPPGNTFNYTTSVYNPSFSSRIKDELIARFNSRTGLTPAIEEALWSRGSDRESKASLLAQDTLLIDRASFGFSRPTGAMLSALDNIVMESQAKLIELSREIAIKQAELEQANIKENISQSLALEELLLKTYIDAAQRALDVAKYKQDVAIELFKASTSVYQLEVEAYKAFSASYEARVKAELNKLEVYKTSLDAERLKSEVNDQRVKLYLATIDGIKANVDLYRADIQGVSEKLKAEAIKLDVYSSEIKNYSTLVESKVQEFNMYSSKVNTEKVKSDIYSNQVQAYATRVQAYASQTELDIKKADIGIQAQELSIKKYEADTDFYIKKLQAKQLTYQGAIDLYKGQAEIYRSKIDYQVAKAGVNSKKIELDIANHKSKADVAIQNANLKLQALLAGANSTIEGRKAAGSIHQALAQASLSAVNISMGASASVSNTLQEQHDFTQ